MSDETHDAANAPTPDSDDYVSAHWQVTVMPGENISIHYQVSPKSQDDSITSVSASVVEKENGIVSHSFLGATTSDSLAPKPGQGMVGDVGADTSVFHGHDVQGEIRAILAGTVRTGETIQNFFFSRGVDLTEVEQPAEEEE